MIKLNFKSDLSENLNYLEISPGISYISDDNKKFLEDTFFIKLTSNKTKTVSFRNRELEITFIKEKESRLIVEDWTNLPITDLVNMKDFSGKLGELQKVVAKDIYDGQVCIWNNYTSTIERGIVQIPKGFSWCPEDIFEGIRRSISTSQVYTPTYPNEIQFYWYKQNRKLEFEVFKYSRNPAKPYEKSAIYLPKYYRCSVARAKEYEYYPDIYNFLLLDYIENKKHIVNLSTRESFYSKDIALKTLMRNKNINFYTKYLGGGGFNGPTITTTVDHFANYANNVNIYIDKNWNNIGVKEIEIISKFTNTRISDVYNNLPTKLLVYYTKNDKTVIFYMLKPLTNRSTSVNENYTIGSNPDLIYLNQDANGSYPQRPSNVLDIIILYTQYDNTYYSGMITYSTTNKATFGLKDWESDPKIDNRISPRSKFRIINNRLLGQGVNGGLGYIPNSNWYMELDFSNLKSQIESVGLEFPSIANPDFD